MPWPIFLFILSSCAPLELDEASSLVTPAPPKHLYVTLNALVAGEVPYRIHLEKYDAETSGSPATCKPIWNAI